MVKCLCLQSPDGRKMIIALDSISVVQDAGLGRTWADTNSRYRLITNATVCCMYGITEETFYKLQNYLEIVLSGKLVEDED